MIITITREGDKSLRLEIGDLTLQIRYVAGAPLPSLQPTETLVWIGATFFAQRPQTITPMSGEELEGKATGIVWTHQAGRSLWELRAWADGDGDLFQRLRELLSLRLLTVPQAAARLRVNRLLVTRLCRAGKLPGVLRIEGHGWLIPEASLSSYRRRRRGRPRG